MIPFLQLTPGEDAAAVQAAIARVVARGWFILGPEVEAFEREFAAWLGMPYALAHNTGTAALHGAMFGLGIGSAPAVTFTLAMAAGMVAFQIWQGGRVQARSPGVIADAPLATSSSNSQAT